MATTTSARRTTAALRWAPVISAAYAQATAFASAAVLAFLVTDVAADLASAPAVRLWPLGALALGLVAAASTARRDGAIGPARYTGSAALAGLTASAFAAALAPNFAFMLVAALGLGISGGLVVTIAGRAVADVGGEPASVAAWTAAVSAGVLGGVGSLFVVPALGWRGAMGLVVVAAVLATWKFAEHTPRE